MAGEVVVDALPYVDHEYDEPGVREAVRTATESDSLMFWSQNGQLSRFGT